MIISRLRSLLILVAILAATFMVYQRGLSGTFILDDYHNITNNPRISIDNLNLNSLISGALSRSSGPLRRPISMASFSLNYYATGYQPFYFKLTNLCIHFLNGIGVYFMTSLILSIYQRRFQPAITRNDIRWISFTVTAAWLLHPLNVTGVLYVVQRMTSLSALFSIWGMVIFLWGRIRLYEGKGGVVAILTGTILFTALAALSKENGILLPALIFIAEFTLFKFETKEKITYYFLIILYLLIVALPTAAILFYTFSHPAWFLNGYSIRPFTLMERLLTETRVIWFYIKQTIFPVKADMGLFHDDYIISRSLLNPISTLFSMVGIFTLIILGAISVKKLPIFAFGIFFFLVGHSMESTFIPLEIAYEHRNYLPMYGIIFILFLFLQHPLNLPESLLLRKACCVLLIALFAFDTYSRSSDWSNPFDLAKVEVENHPNSLRANAEMANIITTLSSPNAKNMETYYISARRHYEKMVSLDTNDIHGLIGLILLNASKGKEPDADWIRILKDRLTRANLPVNVGQKLEGLVSCQAKKQCSFPPDELEALLRAPLKNPNLVPRKRASILSALSTYLVNVKQDYPAALIAMRETADTAPWSFEYRFILVTFLSALGRYPEAKEQLALAKQLDSLQTHTAELNLQDKLISRHLK